MIRVIVVDDQPLVRSGFKMILEAQSDIKVVSEAGDGKSAIEKCRSFKPDVVLMDIRMPVLDGLEATRQLQDFKILVLTTFSIDDYVVEALRAGACGFLLKDATPEELVTAVRAIAAGDAALSPAAIRMLLDIVRSKTPVKKTLDKKRIAELSTREHEVLLLLAQGLSNSEICAELYVSEATVKSHVSHVLAKLGLRDRVQAVVAAYELGIIEPRR